MSADEIQQALRKLKLRLSAGEIDEATYDRLKERILGDLTTAERTEFGLSPTPSPVSLLGPSGGSRGGLKTGRVTLADLNLAVGTILLDQWRLARELGRGGFGAVYEAEELHLRERQAVKVLDPTMVAKEELLSRFRREVLIMRKLVHPRIVRVFDYREDPEQLLALISMELVPFGSVKQLVAQSKTSGRLIPVPLVMSLLRQILEALAEAHRQGVIHRDVTPGNVLLAGATPGQLLDSPLLDPQVKLVDFGIAGLVERTELSAKSRVLGTAAYVAPEVLDPSVEVSPAADIYGAGAMAYELLTGELPSGRFENPRELRPEIPEEFERFVIRLLERRAEKRPSAVAALAELGAASRRIEEEEFRPKQQAAPRSEVGERRRLEEEELRRSEGVERDRLSNESRAAAGERERRQEQERVKQEQESGANKSRGQQSLPPTQQSRAHEDGVARLPVGRRHRSGANWIRMTVLLFLVALGIGWAISKQRQAQRERAEVVQRHAVSAEEQPDAPSAERAQKIEIPEKAGTPTGSNIVREGASSEIGSEAATPDKAASSADQRQASAERTQKIQIPEKAGTPTGSNIVREGARSEIVSETATPDKAASSADQRQASEAAKKDLEASLARDAEAREQENRRVALAAAQAEEKRIAEEVERSRRAEAALEQRKLQGGNLVNAPRLTLETSLGKIVIELNPSKAPISVENFLSYVRSGHFDGTIFHRVIPGFMVQGGGFDREMAQKKVGAPIENEAKNGLRNDRGTIAMARTANPNSATAQFFINTVNNDGLNRPRPDGHGYAVFGRVVEGMAVVDAIEKVRTGNRGGHQNVPVEPVLIVKATIVE